MADHCEMLVEPFCISDTFASGAIDVEDMGDTVRMTFYVRQRSLLDGTKERAVVARLVLTSDAFAQFCAMLAAGNAETAKRPTPHRIGGLQ